MEKGLLTAQVLTHSQEMLSLVVCLRPQEKKGRRRLLNLYRAQFFHITNEIWAPFCHCVIITCLPPSEFVLILFSLMFSQTILCFHISLNTSRV